MNRFFCVKCQWTLFVLACTGYCVSLAAAAPKKTGPPRAHYPAFSWDTVPQYIHIRKADAFTEEEVAYLAGFPLITLEKTTGSSTYGSSDVGSLTAAAAIKAINPEARVLYYRNVFVHYPGTTFDQELKEISAPYLRGKKGKGKLVRGTFEGYDLTNPTARDWWGDSAVAVTHSPHIDGLFLDGNVKALEPRYLGSVLKRGKKAEVAAGYLQLIKATRKAMDPNDFMLANIIRARFPKAGLEHMGYFDGSYLEAFEHNVARFSRVDYVARGISAAQVAARKGRIIAMTFGLGEAAQSEQGIDETRHQLTDHADIARKVEYYTALFLICAEKYSYLSLHDGYHVGMLGKKGRHNYRCASLLWLKQLPALQKPLGPPKGPAKREGYRYSRKFEHATVALNIESERAKITWHEVAPK